MRKDVTPHPTRKSGPAKAAPSLDSDEVMAGAGMAAVVDGYLNCVEACSCIELLNQHVMSKGHAVEAAVMDCCYTAMEQLAESRYHSFG